MRNVYCDGIQRRDFLKVGVLGATGLTLADYLRMADAGQVDHTKAKAAIFVSLVGGPSHMDTFDLKPNAPKEYRGEFKPTATKAPGVEISEHLPKLAQCTDKFAILRGVTHNLAAHQFGRMYMNTGNRPIPSLQFPCYGSVISKELPAPSDLPPFVSIPDSDMSPGYLGIEYAALSTGATPRAGAPFAVRGISLGRGLTVQQIEKRHRLLDDLDHAFEGYEKQSDLLNGLDRFGQQAHNIIRSNRAREAFDVSRESPAITKSFGDSNFGQSCLLASRLVEAGVRFVTVSFGGWDTHQGNFDRLKINLLPQLDTGLAALFTTLASKGLLSSTAVFVTGEFGRTPKINAKAGRDHWARAMFVLLGGGPIHGGQVVGASDDKGMGPAGKGFTPDEVAASFYHAMGIPFQKEYHTATGRPVMIVRDGKVIPQLFS